MLVHVVLFWLREDLSPEERSAFFADLATLDGIGDATAVYRGTPAATAPRPVVDSSWDACLTVLLDSVDAHDRYQTHPLHTAFLDRNRARFGRVVVYDAD